MKFLKSAATLDIGFAAGLSIAVVIGILVIILQEDPPTAAAAPAPEHRCVVLDGGGFLHCDKDQARAILDACPNAPRPSPCAADARAAVDALGIQRLRADGFAALIDLHENSRRAGASHD